MGTGTKFPLLTVVVPVYNGERYIKNTVGTILKSDYSQIEVLLVDDGSQDESGILCKELAEGNKRIRYIRQENSGIAAARNTGLLQAGGEYICFCDQDDFVEPFMYSDVLGHMLEHSAPMGMCSTGRDMDGKKSGYEFLEDGCYGKEEILTHFLYPLLFRGYSYPFVQGRSYVYGTIWKCIYNREFLIRHGVKFRKFVNYEDDWIFVTETLSLADIIITSSRIGYFWRVNRTSRSHTGHCIADITKRFEEMDRYVMGYLGKRILEKDILREYGSVLLCGHYEEGYRNMACDGTREEKRLCKARLTKYLLDSDYKGQLRTLRYLKGNVFRRRFLYLSLKYLGIRCTFWINRVLLLIEKNGSKVQWLVALERKAKRKG